MVSSKGSVHLKILDSDSQIKEKIYESIAEDLNKKIRKNRKRVVATLKNSVQKWVARQPEVASLLSYGARGSLNAQFGIPPSDSDISVNAIISAVVDSININIIPIDKRLKGTIEFSFQSADFLNLLGLPRGHITTEMGTDLHWLEWLLTKGDTIVVAGYGYTPGNTGRSGGGTMDIGGAWRVPPEFSGTLTNNFITRSFDGTEREISGILKGLLT